MRRATCAYIASRGLQTAASSPDADIRCSLSRMVWCRGRAERTPCFFTDRFGAGTPLSSMPRGRRQSRRPRRFVLRRKRSIEAERRTRRKSTSKPPSNSRRRTTALPARAALELAIRARDKAGEIDRAATLLALALNDIPVSRICSSSRPIWIGARRRSSTCSRPIATALRPDGRRQDRPRSA